MAQERTIRTVLELNVSKFQANAARAGAAAKGLARELDAASRASQNLDKNAANGSKAAKTARDLEQSYSRVGTTMLGAGTAMAAGLGVAVKAAMDWESAWAGVKKTVDGTPQQMAELEGELRGLAKTLPATHTEIAECRVVYENNDRLGRVDEPHRGGSRNEPRPVLQHHGHERQQRRQPRLDPRRVGQQLRDN